MNMTTQHLPTIVAVDPGEHIGIAKRCSDGSILLDMILYNKVHPNGLDDLVLFLKESKLDTLVIENFSTAGHLTVPAWHTIMALGCAIGCARTLGANVVIFSPQNRYTFLEDARKAYPGHIVHEIDAYAHLLTYLHRYERTSPA